MDEKLIKKVTEEAENFKAQMHEVVVKLKRCLSVYSGSKKDDPKITHVSTPNPQLQTRSASSLPKLSLSKFNGDLKRWLELRDCSKVAVNDYE